jgi:hypothetical protein
MTWSGGAAVGPASALMLSLSALLSGRMGTIRSGTTAATFGSDRRLAAPASFTLAAKPLMTEKFFTLVAPARLARSTSGAWSPRVTFCRCTLADLGFRSGCWFLRITMTELCAPDAVGNAGAAPAAPGTARTRPAVAMPARASRYLRLTFIHCLSRRRGRLYRGRTREGRRTA